MDRLKVLLKVPEKANSKKIFKLIKDTNALDLNSEYLYLLQSTHFTSTCSIGLLEEEVVGFVSGYRQPQKPNALFIWQVAIDKSLKGQGLANKLMFNILERKENIDLTYIHTTVSPSNKASIRVFEKLAEKLDTKIESKDFLKKEDFINQHEEEVLYEIGPFNLKEKNENI